MNNAITYAGLTLYPFHDKWAVQLPENQSNDTAVGDTLHLSLDAAKEEALLITGDKTANTEQVEKPFTPWLGGPENMKESAYEKRALLLKGLIRCDGTVMKKRQFVEMLVERNLALSVRKEPKVKDMSRMRHFRANNEQQQAHEMRQKMAGCKNVYYIGGYEVSKTEHDYAMYLYEQKELAQAKASRTGTLPLAELYRRWDALGNIPTCEDEDGVTVIDTGFGTTFLPGTPVEDIWHWFEAKHPRFSVGEVMNGIRHQRGNVRREGYAEPLALL